MKCSDPRIWNNTVENIKEASHIDIFKAKLK